MFCAASASAAWVAPPLVLRRPVAAQRHCAPHCEQLPEAAADAIPPNKLAGAWKRDEQARELDGVLKGCSLYLVGLGPRKAAIGKVLARRLAQYRVYDVSTILLSTVRSLNDGQAISMEKLLESEPLDDVKTLADAVLREIQQYTRAVFVTWDGSVERSDFMVMQQGIVVHLDFEGAGEQALTLKNGDGAETLAAWQAGHRVADVQVPLAEGLAADDAVEEVMGALLKFIEKNPAKSAEWKAEADEKLAANPEKAPPE